MLFCIQNVGKHLEMYSIALGGGEIKYVPTKNKENVRENFYKFIASL